MKQLFKLPLIALFILILTACSGTAENETELNEQKSPVLVMFYTEN